MVTCISLVVEGLHFHAPIQMTEVGHEAPHRRAFTAQGTLRDLRKAVAIYCSMKLDPLAFYLTVLFSRFEGTATKKGLSRPRPLL